jgi:hypothetical protein
MIILDFLEINYFPSLPMTFLSSYPDSAIALSAVEVPYNQDFDDFLGIDDITLFDSDRKFPGLYTYRDLSNNIPQIFTKYLTSSITGKHYNFGNTANPTDRAIGVIYSSTTGPIRFGLRFRNNTGYEIKSLVISFTGEEWRSGSGGTAALNQLTFDYSQATSFTDLLTGTYTPVDALTFTAPYVGASGSTAVTLDGNYPAYRRFLKATVNVSIPKGEEIMLRWSDITDDLSYDCALAVDDLTVIPKSVSTGTDDVSAKKYIIRPYPNPVNDILNIDNSDFKAHVLEIYDITGRRLIMKEIMGEIVNIDVSSLSKGLYIINMSGPEKTITGKFIKN